MAKLQADLREFIALLNSHDAEYLIVGPTSISGVDFESAWASRVPTILDDQPVNVLGWDELLRNKRATGRQKDLADIEKLLAVAKRPGH